MPDSTGVWTPRAYGGKCDGVTDDHAAIQHAIDLCSSNGGGTVTLPGGRIRNDAPLVLKDGVNVRGQGPSTYLFGNAPLTFVLPDSGPRPDHYGVSDLLIGGGGINLNPQPLTGGHQLGWARVTIDNVTIVEAPGHAVFIDFGIIEARLINVVSLRAQGVGFYINGTDNFLIGCTAAAGARQGFVIAGGNTKLTASKSYGNTGIGFHVAGAGRHMFSACEAQDNGAEGFQIGSDWNTFAACLADSNKGYGYVVNGHNNSLSACAAMYGGGGSGQVTGVGYWTRGTRNIISGNTNCATPVLDDSGANRRTIMTQGFGGHVID